MIVEVYVVRCDCARLHGDHGAGCQRDVVVPDHFVPTSFAIQQGWQCLPGGFNWLSPQCAAAVAEGDEQ